MPVVLEPIWVGRRVSVRRTATRTPEGRQLYSDVVGDLVDLSTERAVIASHGNLVTVPVSEVALARLVPASTAEELALEEVAAKGWRAAEIESLGGWTLRANNGFTVRANSVHAVRQPSLPLEDAIAYARDWYAARGLPLRISLPTEGRRLLDAALGERGFEPSVDSHIMAGVLERLNGDAADATLTSTPDEDWFNRYRGGKGIEPANRALLLRHDEVAFAGLRRDGELVAIGRGTIDDGWLGITAVEVVAEHRRRGLAKTLMAALWDWGRLHGAERTYLQVESTNHAAVELYTALGYWIHHSYRTRTEVEGPVRDLV